MKKNIISLTIALLLGVYIGICKLGTPVAEAANDPPTIINLTSFSKLKPFDLNINANNEMIKAHNCSPEVNVTITTVTRYYPYVVNKNKIDTVINKIPIWIEVDKNIVNSLKTTPILIRN